MSALSDDLAPGLNAEIVMPKLSDSMEEGTIVRWLVADGSAVRAGQEVVEIESDKATMGHETDAAGMIQQLVQEGAAAPVGSLIARVLVPGGAPPPATQPRPERESLKATQPPSSSSKRPRNASSIARRVADRLQIDIAQVNGSGPRGRVFKADVEAFHKSQVGAGESNGQAPAPPSEPATSVAPAPAAPAHVGNTGPASHLEPLTRTQQRIAQRMVKANSTIPDFVVQRTVDMDACVRLRQELKLSAGADRPTPSFNDFIVRAAALSLREHPLLNASYRDGQLERHQAINIGIAVAAPGSLLVPTVFAADTKSISQIAAETRALGESARNDALIPAQVSGATFTVSNLGMLGIDRFTAVVNAPQAAILAVGRVVRAPAVIGEQVGIRSQMELSLSCDHRIVYGADAAAFLGSVSRILEGPLQMI